MYNGKNLLGTNWLRVQIQQFHYWIITWYSHNLLRLFGYLRTQIMKKYIFSWHSSFPLYFIFSLYYINRNKYCSTSSFLIFARNMSHYSLMFFNVWTINYSYWRLGRKLKKVNFIEYGNFNFFLNSTDIFHSCFFNNFFRYFGMWNWNSFSSYLHYFNWNSHAWIYTIFKWLIS